MPSAFIRVDADIQHGLAHVMRGKDGCFERMPEKPPEAAMMMVGGCRQQMHEACKVPDDRHQVALDFIVR